jgi:hypothetical protein
MSALTTKHWFLASTIDYCLAKGLILVATFVIVKIIPAVVRVSSKLKPLKQH